MTNLTAVGRLLVGARVVALGLGSTAGFSKAEPRSTEAFGDLFEREITDLAAKYRSVDTEDPDLGALLTVVQGPGHLSHLVDELNRVAPSDIQTSVEGMAEAIDRSADADPTDPPGALGTGLVNAAMHAGDFQRVGEYVDRHCEITTRP